MKSIQLATTIGSFIFAALLSLSANAARYIVVMKSKEVFVQTHAQVMTSGALNMASVQLIKNGQVVRPFANVEATVEDSLENLNSVVLNIEDDQMAQVLASNSAISIVEKEYFLPSPKPVAGFQLTQPWAYDLKARTLANNNGTRAPWGINAVRAPQAWKASKAGQGARVAVLDTGIDKDHPALAANFEAGRDFVMDNNTPYDFADKEGHGTHCAGTIGAVQLDDGFVGVAPNVKLLSGRVCGSDGCSNIAVAQGINWAIAQKVDVISMSLGGAMATPAEQKAIKAADAAGVVVVAASGNDGTPKVSYPAAFPSVIAVGAVDSKITKAKFSQWGPELAVVAPGVDVLSSVPRGSGRESIVKVAIGTTPAKLVVSAAASGANEFPNPVSNVVVPAGLGKTEDFKKINVSGKYALIQRGEIKFTEKVANAIAANAAGVVFYNNEEGVLSPSVSEGSNVAIPVVMIEQAVGVELVKQVSANQKVTVTIQTTPSDYAGFAGTSMATPHVAGIAALMRAANKNLTPAQVKSILKATATALTPNNQNQVGSGMVNAEKAVQEALKN